VRERYDTWYQNQTISSNLEASSDAVCINILLEVQRDKHTAEVLLPDVDTSSISPPESSLLLAHSAAFKYRDSSTILDARHVLVKSYSVHTRDNETHRQLSYEQYTLRPTHSALALGKETSEEMSLSTMAACRPQMPQENLV
jgi:hypothetical protein